MTRIGRKVVITGLIVLVLAACSAPQHDKPWQAGYSTGMQIWSQMGLPDSAKSDPSVAQFCDQSLLGISDPYAGKVTDWTDGYEAGCYGGTS